MGRCFWRQSFLLAPVCQQDSGVSHVGTCHFELRSRYTAVVAHGDDDKFFYLGVFGHAAQQRACTFELPRIGVRIPMVCSLCLEG